LARWWIVDTQQPIHVYVILAVLTTLVPAMLVSLALSATGSLVPGSVPELSGLADPSMALFLFIVVSPLAETLLMAAILAATRLVSESLWIRAAISALVWAALHSAVASMWGVVILWPFFVFSCSYLAWRNRSRRHAIGVTCIIHMCHNALPSLFVILFSG
jgi:membrane protease YdiL (CAAX protease family)